jgi:hypothetical protein
MWEPTHTDLLRAVFFLFPIQSQISSSSVSYLLSSWFLACSFFEMEATYSCETSVDFQQTTPCYIPEDRTLQGNHLFLTQIEFQFLCRTSHSLITVLIALFSWARGNRNGRFIAKSEFLSNKDYSVFLFLWKTVSKMKRVEGTSTGFLIENDFSWRVCTISRSILFTGYAI